MTVSLSRIKRPWLRRLVMIASLPFLICLTPVLAVLCALIEIVRLNGILYFSWGPCWRGETATQFAEVGVVRDKLVMEVPLELLAFAAERAPFIHTVDDSDYGESGGFKVVDRMAFGRAVAKEIRCEQSEDTGTLLHEMLDDAMERVVEMGGPGWIWPAYGRNTPVATAI